MRGTAPKPVADFPIPPPQETVFDSVQSASEHTTHVLNQWNSKAEQTGWRLAIAHDAQSERQLLAIGYERMEDNHVKELGLNLVSREIILKTPYGQFKANQDRNMAMAAKRTAAIASQQTAEDPACTEERTTQVVSLKVPGKDE